MLAKNTSTATGQEPECASEMTPLMMVSSSSLNERVRAHDGQYIGWNVQ